MRHARKDYERFQDPENKIPKNEPVFILRGQDMFASDLLRVYALMLEESEQGYTKEEINLIKDWAKEMDSWKTKKYPDFPTK